MATQAEISGAMSAIWPQTLRCAHECHPADAARMVRPGGTISPCSRFTRCVASLAIVQAQEGQARFARRRHGHAVVAAHGRRCVSGADIVPLGNGDGRLHAATVG